eukprot:TRINITY_DN1396_c0_g1_i3.p1 TRINITY_DN1396_c0_g1~~TRINITY_DN1396_c0_g1_i3.p1  ORF type:complete len:340 (+),score=50.77 TRINITY_DN1396_c0_g1_i3:201-1220(+)
MQSFARKAFTLGVQSVHPRNLFPQLVKTSDGKLQISLPTGMIEKEFASIDKFVLIGGGKASGEMAIALSSVLKDSGIPMHGIVNVAKGQQFAGYEGLVPFNYARHPVPDEDGVNGVREMFKHLETTTPNSLVFILISGGASALMPLPSDGISLEDIQEMTKVLLSSGISIGDINTIRKHVSGVNGGRLGLAAVKRGATCITFIISDVIGDDLSTIGSGPTVYDPTTIADVLEICHGNNIFEKLPISIQDYFSRCSKNQHTQIEKEAEKKILENVHNPLIGSSRISAQAVQSYLESEGFTASIWSTSIDGEASTFGSNLLQKITNLIEQDQSKKKDTWHL